MDYGQSQAEYLKAAIPPYAFYARELTALHSRQSNGWRDGGLCPFHDDRRPGSFKVNLESGGFVCFSCGAKGGDIIAFLILRDSLTFPEALGVLRADWGV